MLRKIRYLSSWPHEILHYLAAKALGLHAHIEPGLTRYVAKRNWEVFVVLLAPAFVGLLALPFIGWQILDAGSEYFRLLWWVICLMDFLWLIGCAKDFWEVLKLLWMLKTTIEAEFKQRHLRNVH